MVKAVVCILLLAIVGLVGYAFLESSSQVDQEPVITLPKSTSEAKNQSDFDRAIALMESGDEESAVALMDRLTREIPPFVPAHRFFAAGIIRSGAYKSDLEALKKLTGHLYVVADSGDDKARIALAQIYVAARESNDAIELLRVTAVDRPGVYSILAKLLVLNGDQKGAAEAAKKAAEYLTEKLEADPDNPRLRLALAECLGIVDRNAEAVAVLRVGAKDFPELGAAMTGYAVRQIDPLIKAGNADSQTISQAIEILRQSLEYDPTSVDLWSRVFQLSMEDGDVDGIAKDLVQRGLEDGRSGGTLELVRGTHAYSTGDLQSAIADLERAYQQTPDRAAVLSKLAWYLARGEPPQFERSMSLADQLVETHPDRLQYRETRGQILALMNRDDEAIEDLKLALKAMPRHQPLIDTLASLYLKQGNEAKAIALRERAAARTGEGPEQEQARRDLVDEILKGAKQGDR